MSALKTSTILITVFAALMLFILAFSSGKGIIALGDYEHAVAFCGCEFDHVVFQPDEASVKYDATHDITYVINKGHEMDMGVVDLMALAEHKCKELEEEK